MYAGLLGRYIFSEPKLRARVDVDALGGEMRTTPLFWAAFHNHIYAVELLLRHGADPGFADGLGSNPFLLAIQVRVGLWCSLVRWC